jgi:metal-responsive CopG/Arc/MetJ family transcriptional regulator
MKRATISLPDDLAQDVAREAQRRRVSVSEVTRDALREHLERPAGGDLPFVGIGRSGQHNTARRAEEILAHEWGDARGR